MTEYSYLKSMQDFCVTQAEEFKRNGNDLISSFWMNAAEGFKQRAEEMDVFQASYCGV